MRRHRRPEHWTRPNPRSVSASARTEEAIVIDRAASGEQGLIERFRRARKDQDLAVLEGLHALKHALRFEAEIELACSDDRSILLALAGELAPDVRERLESLVDPVSADAFAALTPRPPETGVVALAKRPRIDVERLIGERQVAPVIWLEDPAHLGNVGAVVRVAAAAGAAAVITSGLHDPWDPAALRGSAGLHFALPVARFDSFQEAGTPLIAIDPKGETFRPDLLPNGSVLAFGSERRGLSADLLDRADRRFSLPMREHVSSLNLATAVSAVLYAWRLAIRR